ncbi:tetratricopeptide repeat protein [Desulfovibrionales bacterium]
MSKRWLLSKQQSFVRDVLRDFCQIAMALEEQFVEFDTSGEVSFHFFDDLLGRHNCKGLLWRLKDTAHLLFRSEERTEHRILGEYLDWALGYIFHECIKLKEDAYQQRNYKPRFKRLQDNALLSPEEQHIGSELYAVIQQTSESISREVHRVRFILFHCKRMFILYLPLHRENPLLARYLYVHWDFVRQVFKGYFNELMHAVYGNTLQPMYVLAADSFAEGGWINEARLAREMAGGSSCAAMN